MYDVRVLCACGCSYHAPYGRVDLISDAVCKECGQTIRGQPLRVMRFIGPKLAYPWSWFTPGKWVDVRPAPSSTPLS